MARWQPWAFHRPQSPESSGGSVLAVQAFEVSVDTEAEAVRSGQEIRVRQ